MNRIGSERNGTSIELQAQPQSIEAQVHVSGVPGRESRTDLRWKAWLGYRRAIEFDQVPDNKGVGQDNAALRGDDRYIVGVLCDGVSQGFCGDIAATKLTEALLNRLWVNRVHVPDETLFESWLIDIEADIAQAVATYRISPRVKQVIREKMEARKTTVGSQAVMCAFVLDRNVSNGLLNVYQVGDASTHAYISGEITSVKIAPQWKTVSDSQRRFKILHLQCSPEGRVRSIGNSQHHLMHATLTGVAGVVLHSDGVPANWVASLDDTSRPNSVREDLEVWAGRDDASFVVALSPRIETFLNNPVLQPPTSEVTELPGVVEIDYHWGSRVLLQSLSLPKGETATLISPNGIELETAGSDIYLIHKPGANIDGRRIELALSNGKRYTIRHSIVIVDPSPQPVKTKRIKVDVSPPVLPEKLEPSKTKAKFYVPSSVLLLLLLLAGAFSGYSLTHRTGSADPPITNTDGQQQTARPVLGSTEQTHSGSPNTNPVTGAQDFVWTKEKLQTRFGQKKALMALQYDIQPNKFNDAVKQYQRDRQIPQTGKVGPQTQQSLYNDLQQLANSKAKLPSNSNTQPENRKAQ